MIRAHRVLLVWGLFDLVVKRCPMVIRIRLKLSIQNHWSYSLHVILVLKSTVTGCIVA